MASFQMRFSSGRECCNVNGVCSGRCLHWQAYTAPSYQSWI